MSDELVTIAEFVTAFEAEMAKDYLEDNDIKAAVVGDDLIAISPAVGKTWVELKVLAKDQQQAKAILEARKAQCKDVQDDDLNACDCDCDTDCKTNDDCDCDCKDDAGEDA